MLSTWMRALVLGTAAGLVAVTPAAATVRFDAYNLSMSGSQYRSVVMDVDRDGNLDIVGGDRVALGRADGTFDQATAWTSTISPQYLVGGGLISYDSIGDIVTLENNTGADACYLRRYDGNGYGGFSNTPSSEYGVSGKCLQTVLVEDTDFNGAAEAVTITTLTNGVRYWVTTGRGVVAQLPGTSPVIDIAMADVNGDKLLDLLALTQDGLVHQQLGTSTGYATETTFAGAAGAVAIAAGDASSDGKAEVFTAAATSVMTRLGGSGATATYTVPGGGVSGIALGDIDGDAIPEQFLAISYGTDAVRHGLAVRANTNSSTGSFSAPVFYPGYFNSDLTVGTPRPGLVGIVAGSAAGSAVTTVYVNRSTAVGAFSLATNTLPATTVGEVSAPMSLTFRNTGDALLRIERGYLAGLDASQYHLDADGCQDTVLKRNQTCQFSVRFAPTSAGTKNATLRVVHDGENGISQGVLTGTASAPAAVSSARAEDFSAPAESGSITVPGPAGPAGPSGPQGLPGRDGRDGRDGTLQCTGGLCTIALTLDADVKRVVAQMLRHGKVVASGRAKTGRTLRLRSTGKRLKPGRYVLRTVRYRRDGTRTVTRRVVRVR